MSIVNAPLSTLPLRYTFPGFQRTALSNGTPVYLIPRTEEDLVTITVAMNIGSVNDTIAGEISFAAELMSRATQKRTTLELAEEIEQRGCSLRSNADRDASSIVAAGLTEYASDLVGFLAECLLTPRYAPEDIAIHSQRRIAEILMNQSDPDWLAGRAASSVMWHDHPYSRPREGTVETNQQMTHDLLMDVHKRMLSAQKTIIVAGGFDPNVMMHLLNQHLDALPATSQLFTLPEAQQCTRVGAISRKDDAVQTGLRIALPGAHYAHPDYAALKLATEVLGGYQMARLFTVLRETKGYTYGAYAFSDIRRFGTSTTLLTSVGNNFTADTVATIAEELDKMKTQPIPFDELDNARQSILGQFVRSTETPQQTGGMLWLMILHGLPDDYFTQHVKQLQALTPETMLDVQSRYFDTSRWSIGASGTWDVVSKAMEPFVDSIASVDTSA